MGEIKVGELGDLEEIEMRENDGGKEDRRSDLFVYESVDELNFWGWFVLGVVKLNAALEGSGGWRREEGKRGMDGTFLLMIRLKSMSLKPESSCYMREVRGWGRMRRRGVADGIYAP